MLGQAVAWYRKAAQQGFAPAEGNLNAIAAMDFNSIRSSGRHTPATQSMIIKIEETVPSYRESVDAISTTLA